MAKQFIPSPQQAAFLEEVKKANSSIVLEAVAGAGKTTTIVEGCKLMHGDVYLGAYNHKMGKELKERTAGLKNVRAGTFHSVGYSALRFFHKNIGDPDANKVKRIIEQYIKEKGREDLTELSKPVADIVSMAKQRGIGVLEANEFSNWMTMIEWFDLASDLPEQWEDRMGVIVKFAQVILGYSNKAAREDGAIDFDDMCYLPLLWNLRLIKKDWVLIDEAQDTNPVRRALAQKMLKPGGRIIAVGDPHQAIYGFSGADNDAMERIKHDFNARTMPLSVTYRCPKAVVEVAQKFVRHIHAHESAPQGAVQNVLYNDIHQYVKPGDAILCRYNKYLVSLCFRFIKNGIPARIEGRAIGEQLVALTKKWKTNDLQVLGRRVVAWRDREVEKAKAKGKDRKIEEIKDRAETVLVLIEREIDQDVKNVTGLRKMITDMFDDRVADRKGMITLCSAHRSKGLEWDRVFILGLDELMCKPCTQDWQTEQEINLQYVAVTRAMKELYLVEGVREEMKQHSFEET